MELHSNQGMNGQHVSLQADMVHHELDGDVQGLHELQDVNVLSLYTIHRPTFASDVRLKGHEWQVV